MRVLLGFHGDRCAGGTGEEQDGEADSPVRAAADGLQRQVGYVHVLTNEACQLISDKWGTYMY